MRWQAVATLAPAEALPNREHPVGPGVILTGTPEWFKEELRLLQKSVGERDSFLSPFALVCTFEAASYSDPDPAVVWPQPRSKQDAAVEAVKLGALALWLARPTGVTFDAVSVGVPEPGQEATVRSCRPVQRYVPLPRYAAASLVAADLAKADAFATALRTVPRPSATWTALRFLDLALAEELWHVRLLLLWVGIEALFGPEDRRNVQDATARRVARFLNPGNDVEGRCAYELVWKSYEERCVVAHGARIPDAKPDERETIVLEAEGILRSTLRRSLEDPGTLAALSSPQRDTHLEQLAKGFVPPSGFPKPTGKKNEP